MSNMSHVGGRKLGQGKKGATYTFRPETGSDTEYAARMFDELMDVLNDGEAGKGNNKFRVTLHCLPGSEGSGRNGTRPELLRLTDASDLMSFRRFVHGKSLDAFIAKRMVLPTGPERREEFRNETRAVLRVAAAFGRDLGTASTLGAPSFRGKQVFGISIDPAQEYFVLSQRCGPSLDRYRFDDAKAARFVADIAQGFTILHGAELIHGDVKLDNMIHCAKTRRFRLIDWGLAEPVKDLRARYLGHKKPKNYASPMSWYVWGLWKHLSWATFVGYYMLKAFDKVAHSAELRSFILSAGRSFTAFMAAPGSSKLSRATLLARYAYSFDLFNFGVVLAVLATSKEQRLSRAMRQRLLALATRRTHYADPDFIGSAELIASRF